MQPLKILNNVQKARLLHSLLMTEMPGFVAYLQRYADTQLADSDTVRENWDNHFLTADLWLTLAADVQGKCRRYSRDLPQSPHVFADQLFEGYTALYTVHVLLLYTAQPETDPKFRQAAELLFG